MRRLPYLLPVVLFVIVAIYFGVALRPGRDPSELPSVMIDKPAPGFELAGLAGAPEFTPALFKGQVVLVNFFASWCVPCRAEHPLLMRLAAEKEVPLYGIAYKDKPEDAKRFLDQLGDPYLDVGLDGNGRTAIDFGVYGVPETYLLDRDGHIRYRFVGPLSAEALEREILPRIKALGGS